MMIQLTPGTIYLVDQRGLTESDQFSRWSTFNYGDYVDAERKPFGPLLTLNDEVFMPGYQSAYQPAQNAWVLVVPITGEVLFKPSSGSQITIDVGQVYVSFLPAGERFELANVYEDDKINFLYLEFAGEAPPDHHANQLFNFSFEDKQNQLVNITTTLNPGLNLPFKLHIGMFSGRGETLYHMGNRGNLFFAFAVAGAFELQGRLMHQRDGLALWDLHEADMEALSNNAVMLVIEMQN